MPGFEHLAEEFLKDIADLKTIILIGRNCISAQKQKQFASPRNTHQIASETPLGWCIMGSPPPQPTQTAQRTQRKTANRNRPRSQNRPWRMPKGPAECAWCHENNRTDTHPTKFCARFNGASLADQWKVVFRQRTCALCLIGKHEPKKCPEYRGESSRCQDCKEFHISSLQCEETPTDQVQRNTSFPGKDNKRPRAI